MRRTMRGSRVLLVLIAVLGGAALSADTAAFVPAPRPPGNYLTQPLVYSPTWLPAGVTERLRRQDFEGGRVERFWGRDRPTPAVQPDRPWASLSMLVAVTDFPQHQGCLVDTHVDINGRPGSYLAESTEPLVLCWQADPRTFITLYNNGLVGRQALLRIARSVRRDRGWATLPVQPPDGLARMLAVSTRLTAAWIGGTSPTGWIAMITTDPENKGEENSIRVMLARQTSAPAGGEELAVGGRPARYVQRRREAGSTDSFLVVNVGHGLLLTLEAWSFTLTRRGPSLSRSSWTRRRA
jgi:hypothetical protein